MFNALIAKDKRRAVQPNGFAHACYKGKTGPSGFEGVCVGLVPSLDDAMAFLDGKPVTLSYMAYEPWDDWHEGETITH